MDDKWIDSIRDKMMEFEMAPPDGLLESVQTEIKARKAKKWLSFSVAAASVACLVGLYLAYIPARIEYNNPSISEVAHTRYGKEPSKTYSNPVNKTFFASQTSVGIVSSSRGSFLESQISSNELDSVATLEVDETVSEIYDKNNLDKTTENDNPDIRNSKGDDYYAYVDIKTSRCYSHPSIGMVASANGLGGLFDENLGGIPDYNSLSGSTPFTRMGGGMISNSSSNDYHEPTFVEVFDHRLPLRFSLDLSWPIHHHVNVGTGISYSYLRSDIRYGYSDSKLNHALQTLHYIGVPVNIRYTPWSVSKFDFYISGGIMIEKCISGKIKEDLPAKTHYSYDGCNDRPFQFSFNAAAGLQYNLSNKCGVYVEPGVGLYLKNGSKLRTIYSERPGIFNVNIGLRFNSSK